MRELGWELSLAPSSAPPGARPRRGLTALGVGTGAPGRVNLLPLLCSDTVHIHLLLPIAKAHYCPLSDYGFYPSMTELLEFGSGGV